MKSLSTLIDLKQRELDEKRRVLVQLEEELDRLKGEEEELKRSLQREGDIASKQPDMARYFGAFAQGNEKQQDESREKQATMSALIEAQRESITGAFADLKQMEVAKAKMDEEEEADAKRKETLELDEIGIRNYLQD